MPPDGPLGSYADVTLSFLHKGRLTPFHIQGYFYHGITTIDLSSKWPIMALLRYLTNKLTFDFHEMILLYKTELTTQDVITSYHPP